MKFEMIFGKESSFKDVSDKCLTAYRAIGHINTIYSELPSALKLQSAWAQRNYTLIAERRPITDEADLNECIGQPAESDSVESLIAERGKRYGKFSDGAEIMRDLKSVMHSTDGWDRLSNSQQEALDMIQHKIGRVLNGDPNYDDNWKDIAGYATLVVDEILESAKRAIELEGGK